MTSAKPYGIAKRTVWEAYQQVKANRGAAGIDDETIAEFEQNLPKNLYKLWNRMASGSYFPPRVKQVEIPKASGGTRKLGVPTFSDRVAQTVVKLIIEPRLDAIFHPDSYGYRPGRSAKQAVAITRERCWRYDWLVEFDIKAAFDQIDHGLLMKAVRTHIKEGWILLYIERWLVAPFETADGTRIARDRGTPQGGVVSPILMNLFMHYAFDKWMQRESPNCPFARYADDAVVHCRSKKQAEYVMRSIASRLADCGLTMHPEKSKIVYCKDSNRREPHPHVSFTFLGFTFRPRRAKSDQERLFTGFLPGVSEAASKRMRQAVRRWRLTRQTHVTLAEVAKLYNPAIQGWWNYYGAFYPTAMQKIFQHIDRALLRWARRKSKSLAGRKRRSVAWLEKMRSAYPRLFYTGKSWGNRLDNGSRMTRECHVRFCERLWRKFLRPTHHFGMKAHIGADSESGLVHSLHTTPANESDVAHAHEVLHGQEAHVHLDAGYTGVQKREEIAKAQEQGEIRDDVQWHVARMRSKIKQLADGPLKDLLVASERAAARIRSRVEHPFHVVKNLFRHKKARYKGLAKNTAQLYSLFGLANLVIAKNKLLAPQAQSAP